jgi:hypothetical protein
MDFESREATTVENRPKLTIETASHIVLASFDASLLDQEIKVSWDTASEIDNAGFNIWRSEARNGMYTKVNTSIIPAEGEGGGGALYEYLDSDVGAGATHYYKLEAMDIFGVGRFFGPVSVVGSSAWGAAAAQAKTTNHRSTDGSILLNILSMMLPAAVLVLAWKRARRRQNRAGSA